MSFRILVEIITPRQHTIVDLQRLRLYSSLFSFVQHLKPEYQMVPTHQLATDMQHKLAYQAKSFATVVQNGIKYGSSESWRGKKLCYGYVSGRGAVRIDGIYALEIYGKPPLYCALVCPFIYRTIPNLPWRLL